MVATALTLLFQAFLLIDSELTFTSFDKGTTYHNILDIPTTNQELAQKFPAEIINKTTFIVRFFVNSMKPLYELKRDNAFFKRISTTNQMWINEDTWMPTTTAMLATFSSSIPNALTAPPFSQNSTIPSTRPSQSTGKNTSPLSKNRRWLNYPNHLKETFHVLPSELIATSTPLMAKIKAPAPLPSLLVVPPNTIDFYTPYLFRHISRIKPCQEPSYQETPSLQQQASKS